MNALNSTIIILKSQGEGLLKYIYWNIFTKKNTIKTLVVMYMLSLNEGVNFLLYILLLKSDL